MRTPKYVGNRDRDRWQRCHHCNTSSISCRTNIRDRARPCCDFCSPAAHDQELNETKEERP